MGVATALVMEHQLPSAMSGRVGFRFWYDNDLMSMDAFPQASDACLVMDMLTPRSATSMAISPMLLARSHSSRMSLNAMA